MTFRTALSGLNAAQADLNVTANNIANSSTTGFKRSRAEFAELFAVSPQGVSSTATGDGVKVSDVSQQFAQGSIDFTDSNLDLALSGPGFFTVSDGGALAYTRAGAFKTDAAGYVVNAQGQRLQVYPPIDGGGFNTGSLTDLRLVTSESAPNPTSNVEMLMNLPSDATPPTNPTFDPSDPTTFNRATSLTVYDSLGAAHTGTVYFLKDAGAGDWTSRLFVDGTADATPPTNPTFDPSDPTTFNRATSLTVYDSLGAAHTGTVYFLKDAGAGDWTSRLFVDGTEVGTPPTAPNMHFDATGAMTTPANGQIAFLPPYTPATGALPLSLTFDFSGATQYGSTFSVNNITQDGYTTGRLIGMDIDKTGTAQARFTNGRSITLGQVALSAFANPNGLQPLADTTWAETFTSGQALRGQAGNSGFGLVQSGALEASNVDITTQLVNMITAQRNFQANAQMISTSDQITQTIINIR